MKVLSLILILSTCLTAQVETKQYMFKMSPQHLSLNMLKVGVERLNNKHTKSFSVYVYGATNDKEHYYPNFPYTGGGAEIQARKYLTPFTNKTNNKGQNFAQSVYLAGFAQGGVFRWGEEYDNPFTSTSQYHYFDKNVALGFTIWWQRTLLKVLVIDVFAGGGFQKGWPEVEASPAIPIRYAHQNDRFSGPGFTGILPKVGCNIGLVL